MRRPRVFDQRGQYLGDVPPVGADTSQPWGASLWEILHPWTVQDEYTAVGAEPPTVSEIIGSAGANIEAHAAEGVQSFVSAGKWVIIAVVALGALYIYSQLQRHG